MADDEFSVTLEKPVAGGRALARVDGRVVLVSGGIPGERVRVVVERTGKGVAFGRVVTVETPSPDRVEPGTDPRCGGLAFAHVAYTRQLELKRAIVEDALQRIGRLRDLPAIEVVGSPTAAWRLRARLHVRGRDVGFYREGTHTLCDAGPTGQLAPGLLALARETMAQLPPELARAVEAVLVTQSVRGDEQAVHLELSRPLPRRGALLEAAPGGCRGVSAAPALSRHPSVVCGDPWVHDAIADLGVASGGGVILRRHAAAFFQANRALLPRLVGHVTTGAAIDRPVVDLYAGVGLFGLSAAAAGAERVVCVEGDAISAEDLVANAAPFGARVRAVRGDVETFVRQEAAALATSCVIADPPRTGLSPVACQALADAGVSRLVYVSCDPATLARDLALLTASGLRLDTLTLFDLFPLTAHVETIATLTADA